MKRRFVVIAFLSFTCLPAVLRGEVFFGKQRATAHGLQFAELAFECAGRWYPNPGTDLAYIIRHVGRGEDSAGELVVFDAAKPSAQPLATVLMPLQLPLVCFPIQGSGDLMTVWSTGTASVEVVVFSFDSGRVRKVLDEASDWLPEVVVGTAGEPYVMLTYVEWRVTPEGRRIRIPKEAAVYRWNGKGYDPLGRVAFARRFETLANTGAMEAQHP